jgi:hypothetical protein
MQLEDAQGGIEDQEARSAMDKLRRQLAKATEVQQQLCEEPSAPAAQGNSGDNTSPQMDIAQQLDV